MRHLFPLSAGGAERVEVRWGLATFVAYDANNGALEMASAREESSQGQSRFFGLSHLTPTLAALKGGEGEMGMRLPPGACLAILISQ